MSVELYDFAADWCGPCKTQDEILEEVKEKFSDVSFTKVDVDANEKKASEYGVRSLPTLVIEVDGVEKERFVGVTDGTTLSEALAKHTE